MSIPTPWNDKNNCFANLEFITPEQMESLTDIDIDNNTFIRSNLSITNGEAITIPNVFEAINTAYNLIQTITTEIEQIKEQIAALQPSQ